MSTRLVDVAQTALAAINDARQRDADDFVSGVTRTFRAGSFRRRGRFRPVRGNLLYIVRTS